MRNKGITLIALVITIIVLLILAGITISLTLGNQGVITRAQQASKNYKDAEQKEQEELDKFDGEVDDIITGLGTTGEATTVLQPGERSNKTERNNYKDTSGVTATIPEGFTVSKIADEQKIANGLVIYDIPEDKVASINWEEDKDSDGIKDVQEEYNQYVWIPCGTWNKDTQKYSTTEYENAEYYSRKTSETNLNSQNWTSYAYEDNVADKTDARYNGKTGWHNPTEQINSAKESISKYGGFYIGRYEAGVPSEATDFYVASSSSSEGATYEYENNIRDVSTYTPVIKRGNQVWNFISQVKAEEASKNICKDNSAVSSYLIDSNAWNYICKDILKDKLGEDITISTNYGNYSNTEINYEEITGLFAKHTFKSGWDVAPTYEYKQIPEGTAPKGTGSNRLELGAGLSDNFKKYNIYDMAGNMWEWTAETTNAEYGTEHQMINYAVLRGGCLNPSGSVFPIVRSDGNYFTTDSGLDFGFRAVLYMK